MSLSVPALLQAALEVRPEERIEVAAGDVLTVAALDRHSRAVAGAWLAAGYGLDSTITVTPEPGAERAIGLLAAWRVGLLVSDGPDTIKPLLPNPRSVRADHENLRCVAESRVWSLTPAVSAHNVVLTHADIINSLNLWDGAAAAVQALTRYPSFSHTMTEPT